MTELLSYEILDARIVEVNDLLLDLLRVELLHSADDLTTCELLDKEGCTLCCILNYERVCTTLITERRICLEAVSL